MRKLVVELVGTFFLVLTVVTAVGESAALAAIAIGSALMVMVYAGGHISGGHFNPAVSLAVMVRGRLGVVEMVGYWVAQLIGSTAAALLGIWLVDAPGATTLSGEQLWQALVVELLFTFALAFVVLNVSTSKDHPHNSFYGLAVGFTVTAGAVAVGPISGAAFNPAVALGTSISELSTWGSLWVYLVACLVGGAIAGLAFKVLNPDDA
jgi:aquaporin Z